MRDPVRERLCVGAKQVAGLAATDWIGDTERFIRPVCQRVEAGNVVKAVYPISVGINGRHYSQTTLDLDFEMQMQEASGEDSGAP